MSKSIVKDNKKRLNFLKHEKIRKLLTAVRKNVILPQSLREKANFDLSRLPKDSSIVRLRNRCMVTGRARFIFSGFNLSRLTLRQLAFEGKIPYIRKSSW